jgi:hypothetical protein
MNSIVDKQCQMMVSTYQLRSSRTSNCSIFDRLYMQSFLKYLDYELGVEKRNQRRLLIQNYVKVYIVDGTFCFSMVTLLYDSSRYVPYNDLLYMLARTAIRNAAIYINSTNIRNIYIPRPALLRT